MRVARLSQPGPRDGPGGGEEEALVAPGRASEPLLRNPGPCGWMQPVVGVGSAANEAQAHPCGGRVLGWCPAGGQQGQGDAGGTL